MSTATTTVNRTTFMCIDDPSFVVDSLMPKERIQELALYGKQLEEPSYFSVIFLAASRNNYLTTIRLEHQRMRTSIPFIVTSSIHRFIHRFILHARATHTHSDINPVWHISPARRLSLSPSYLCGACYSLTRSCGCTRHTGHGLP